MENDFARLIETAQKAKELKTKLESQIDHLDKEIKRLEAELINIYGSDWENGVKKDIEILENLAVKIENEEKDATSLV